VARPAEDAFVATRQLRWTELDGILTGRALHRRDGATIARAVSLYRIVCSDLMRARSAGYTPDLLAYLDGLVSRAHNAIYGARPFRLPDFVRGIYREFPRAVRKNGLFFALSTALFLIPLAIGLIAGMGSREAATQIIPAEMLEGMAESYSTGFDQGRSEGVDAGMAGFYVYNNVGIAFRCFATGIFFCLGSVFFLVYNGLVIGTVTGFVSQAGYGQNILTFMCGHAPFELTAILIAGAAGLRMGWALVDTGGRTRIGSLRGAAPDITRMVLGAGAMLVIAAGVEAFWSPSSLAPPIKWVAAGVFTLMVAAYLAVAGRARA
jgi:uncharacterized membrane protein SpoIIM required for sporulation